MPVDTSIYANLQPKPFDPLATIGAYASARNALVQGALGSQELQARQGVGTIASESYNPLTGGFDPNKFGAGVASGGAGYLTPDLVQHNAALTGTNISNATAANDLQTKRVNSFYNALGPYANGPVSYRDVIGLARERLQHGLITPDDFAKLTGEIPTDPTKLRAWATNRYESTLPPEIATAPTAGSPNAEGAPTTTTRTQFINRSTGAPGAAPASSASGAVSPSGSGVTTGLSAPQDVSLKQLAADRVKVADFRAQSLPLEKAIQGLDALGTRGTGPGTEAWNTGIAALRNLGVPLPQNVGNANVAYAETRKYLVQNVLANSDTGTNEKLLTSLTGNPNMTIPQAAVSDLAKVALSVRRMNAAKVLEFDREGRPGASYSKWAETWNVNQDPRAYEFDLMTPKAQQATLKQIGPPTLKGGKPNLAYQRFVASLRAAHDNGLLTEPANGQ